MRACLHACIHTSMSGSMCRAQTHVGLKDAPDIWADEVLQVYDVEFNGLESRV